jgi:hypothetical protein
LKEAPTDLSASPGQCSSRTLRTAPSIASAVLEGL